MNTDPITPAFDEQGQVKELQRDLRAILKYFDGIAKAKAGDPKALDEIERAIKAMPASADVASALGELRSRAQALVQTARARRAESFRSLEADYVRRQREAGISLRESGNSAWRIGRVELQVDRDRAQARSLYNKEVVAAWTSVRSADDLALLVANTEKRLEQHAIGEEILPEVFWEAYQHLRRIGGRSDAQSPRFPLKDFYREVRIALARHELKTGVDRKLSRTEFPKWAFLYAIDQYRRISPNPNGYRLSFETGSQHDHQKGLSMVVNGLDARDDYKSYCYVFDSSSGA